MAGLPDDSCSGPARSSGGSCGPRRAALTSAVRGGLEAGAAARKPLDPLPPTPSLRRPLPRCAPTPAGEEALYEEDLGEDEVAAELAPIAAQLAYVGEALGRADEAAAAYSRVLGLAGDDATTASGEGGGGVFAACLEQLLGSLGAAAPFVCAVGCLLGPARRLLGCFMPSQNRTLSRRPPPLAFVSRPPPPQHCCLCLSCSGYQQPVCPVAARRRCEQQPQGGRGGAEEVGRVHGAQRWVGEWGVGAGGGSGLSGAAIPGGSGPAAGTQLQHMAGCCDPRCLIHSCAEHVQPERRCCDRQVARTSPVP